MSSWQSLLLAVEALPKREFPLKVDKLALAQEFWAKPSNIGRRR